MKKWRKLAITATAIAAVIAILIAVAAYLLSTPSVQTKLLKRATQMLSEQLNTRVEIDSASINLWSQDILLYNVRIDDQQQRPMFLMEQLTVDLNLRKLLSKQVEIEEADIKGVEAYIYKLNPDSAANYQFIIDALRSDKPQKHDGQDSVKAKKLTLNMNKLRLRNIYAVCEVTNKKGPLTQHIQLQEANFVRHFGKATIDINNLRFATNNHKPRKNTGKPHRGFFDTGHLDLMTSFRFTINHFYKDTLNATLSDCTIDDDTTGIHISRLNSNLATNWKTMWVSDFEIMQGKGTTLRFDTAVFQLPNKKEGRTLSYYTSTIHGSTILQDISRTFTRSLGKFTLPLELQVRIEGDDKGMKFHDVRVNTTDKRLTIAAEGNIQNWNKKEDLAVRFHVSNMTAKNGIKEEIVNQFVVKKLMMAQMKRLGTITYKGDFAVLYRREQFGGLLSTALGSLNFNFALLEDTKYVVGNVRTANPFHLGKAFDMDKLKDITCSANFRIDFSKARTAVMRRKKGGKLPIGHVDAHVDKVQYGIIKTGNIDATIESDGAVAEGRLVDNGKLADVTCTFSFTNTESLKNMKIKPGVRIHMPWEKKDKKKKKKNDKKVDKNDKKKDKKDKKKKKK